MTKQEFISRVAGEAGLEQREAAAAVDAVLRTIEDTLASGGEVSFSGFGKFHVTHRSPRQGVNPRTGERILIAASDAPKFTAGTALKKAVRS